MTATPPKPPTPPASTQPQPEQKPKRAIDLDSIRKQLDQEIEQANKKLDEAEASGRGFRGRPLTRQPSPQGKSTLPDPAIKDWEIRKPEIGDPGKGPSDPLDRDRDRVEQPEWNATQEGFSTNPASLREAIRVAKERVDKSLRDLADALEGQVTPETWYSAHNEGPAVPTGPISSIRRTPPEAQAPEDEGLTPEQARLRRRNEVTVSKPPNYAEELKLDRELHPKKYERLEKQQQEIEEAKKLTEKLPAGTTGPSSQPIPGTTPVVSGPGIQGPRTSKEVKQG